jgi:hypothetical protein
MNIAVQGEILMSINGESHIAEISLLYEESLLLGIFKEHTGVDAGAGSRGLYGDRGGGTGAFVATVLWTINHMQFFRGSLSESLERECATSLDRISLAIKILNVFVEESGIPDDERLKLISCLLARLVESEFFQVDEWETTNVLLTMSGIG